MRMKSIDRCLSLSAADARQQAPPPVVPRSDAMCALGRRAMCRRLLFKLQKTACVVFFYFMLYVLVSYAISPDPHVAFVGEDVRVGGRYAVLFLVAPRAPLFTDAEGADVFATRRCGSCFITNNRGFLPMSEYDAVLIHGNRSLLTATAAGMEPGKRYLIETSDACLRRKLQCPREPSVTSFSSRAGFSLCGLCDELLLDPLRLKR